MWLVVSKSASGIADPEAPGGGGDGIARLRPPRTDLGASEATRLRRPRWRDPQLLLGAAMVLISMVVGVRVVAAAGDTVPVLVARQDLAAGEPLTPDSVHTREVRLDGGYDQYFTGALDGAHVIRRAVGAGELLPRSAVADADELAAGAEAVRLVTLAVPGGELPAGLARGHVVDIWRVTEGSGAAEPLATGVTVTQADTGGALGMAGSEATVTLSVRGTEEDLDERVAELIGASREGEIYLSRLP